MVLCDPPVRDYLINYARSLIYTTALGFPFLASIRTSYELLLSGHTELVSHRFIKEKGSQPVLIVILSCKRKYKKQYIIFACV